MTTLTPEQRALGRDNANTVIGVTRRDFLKTIPVGAAVGAYYFGYKAINEPVRAAIIGTGNEGCGAMIHDHNREYLDFVGFFDIRPSNQARARKEFANHKDYGPAAAEKLKAYDSLDEMLADDRVEVVVIALPLWLHAPVAIRALKAKKHVFCEKLMAHSVGECKAMIRAARAENRLLAIGHQRHYSALYDNANYLVSNGHLGEIRHIRALWHRNNAIPKIQKSEDGNPIYDAYGEPQYVRDADGRVVYFDGWKPDVPVDDQKIDLAKHTVKLGTKDYRWKDVPELVRWRLFNRTGAGLMAELGSHQLDACSIFLGKKHPILVSGVGGTFFYDDGREVDDHVFCTFEFPGEKRKDDHVVVTYSSINTNRFEDYGEMVYGSRATMIVQGEKDLMLYKETDNNTFKGGGGPKSTSVTVESRGGKPVVETSPSLAGAPAAATALGTLATDAPSRGYREELEHFAYCVRHGDKDDYHAPSKLPREELERNEELRKIIPRCRGEVALADAVIALTSNIAMRERRTVKFDEAWFDFEKDDTPDNSADDLNIAQG